MAETMFTPLDTNLEAMFGEKYEPSGAAVARERLQNLDRGSSGFLPNALAIGSALQGNFNPLMQLQEQKRRTAIGIGILPELSEIQKLQANRKWEEAQQRIEMLGLSVGPRAPEMVPLFQQLIAKSAKGMEDQRTNESLVNLWSATPIANKDHPSNKLFKAFEKEVKTRGPFTEAIRNNIMSSMKLHVQNFPTHSIHTSEATNERQIIQNPQFMSEKDIPKYTGGKIAEHYGINPAQIAMVINDAKEPVEMKGYSIPYGHQLREQLKRDYYALQGTEADLTIAPLVPQEPVLATQQLAQGVSPLSIATRTYGPNAAQQSLEGNLERKVREQLEPTLRNPYAAVQAGIMWTDDQGRRRPVGSYRDFQSQGGLQGVTKDDAEKVIEPVIRAGNALQYLPDMFKAYGNVDTSFASLGKRLQTEIGKRLGIPITPNMTLGVAAANAVRRAINEAELTQAIDSTEVSDLMKLVSGKFASPEQAIEAANFVMQRLNARLDRARPGTSAGEPIDPRVMNPSLTPSQTGEAPKRAVPIPRK